MGQLFKKLKKMNMIVWSLKYFVHQYLIMFEILRWTWKEILLFTLLINIPFLT